MRRVWVIVVLGSTLASSLAWAQQAPPPPPPAQVPPPPRPAAEWQIAVPMSQRLVLNRGPKNGSSYWIERGGVLITDSSLATGLDVGLAGSQPAVELARESHQKLSTGAVLLWTGFGVALVSLGTEVGVLGTLPANANSLSTAQAVITVSALGGLLAGIILEVIGGNLQRTGLQLECDAVNAYNTDLVDGKLQAGIPASLPPGK